MTVTSRQSIQCCNSIFVSAFWSTVHVVENKWETIHNLAQYGGKPLSGQQRLYPKIWTQNYGYCHIKAEVNFLHISLLVDFSRPTESSAVCTRLFCQWHAKRDMLRAHYQPIAVSQFLSSKKIQEQLQIGKKIRESVSASRIVQQCNCRWHSESKWFLS